MGMLELFLLAVGLSMDAFAVALCKGLCMRTASVKNALIVGLWFGAAQALMPLIGYFLGVSFAGYIQQYDHWVAFVLLGFLGVKMIREAFGPEEECEECPVALRFRDMLVLSIATSIDALAAGITFAFLQIHIVPAVSFIGVTTFLLSAVGVKIGNIFGVRFKKWAELAGGIILILMGVKVLLEHLGILTF